MIKEPMLAAPLLDPTVEHTDEVVMDAMKKLKYPVLATLKKDGIRGLKTNDLVSRRFKLIPNKSIRERASILPEGFDMELWSRELRYDEIQSIVMSGEHEDSDKIKFHILDNFSMLIQPYKKRAYDLWLLCVTKFHHYGGEIIPPLPKLCNDANELFAFEKRAIEELGEGICFRTPDSPYKEGRSTLREQYLVKLSRYVRTEVTIVGFEEQFLNANGKKHNAIGKMERSSMKSGMVGKEMLGSFIVRDSNALEFKVGTGVGLTDKKRIEIWREQDLWLSKQITIKHKPHGMKLKPRSPIFIGKREEGF